MRWQPVARTVIAAVGVGTAIALYTQTRSRPVAGDRPDTPPVAPGVTMQSGRGVEVQTKGDPEYARLEYQSFERYDDGRLAYKGFHYKFLKDGTEAWADSAELKGKSGRSDVPNEWSLTGHVKWQRPGDMMLETASATYNDGTGVATIPGPLSFSKGTIAGSGVGGAYERASGNFRVMAGAQMTMRAADGSGTVAASAKAMTFVSGDRSMLFEEDARIAREAETLTSDRATLYLADGDQTFRLIEQAGHAQVLPAPDKPGSLPEMHGERISLALRPDSQLLERAIIGPNASMVLSDTQGRRSIEAMQVSFNVARDGKTLTRLEATDHVVVKTPPNGSTLERTISSSTLVATGDDAHGLTAALFAGGASFVENVPAAAGKPASKRSGTSQQLALKLAGKLDAVDEARFQQDVIFRSADFSGEADIGVYDSVKSVLELQPAPRAARKLPHVDNGTMTVDAAESIVVNLTTNNLDARRDVKTVSAAGASGPSKRGSGIFNGSQKIIGAGAELHHDDAKNDTLYRGTATTPARLVQGDTVVSGLEVRINSDTQDLTATGHVTSTFVLADSGSAAAPPAPNAPPKTTTYQMWADSLVYKDADRAATYVGVPATLRSADGETTAATIVLTLAEGSQKLERLTATATVHASMTEGREAVGDELTYDAATDKYTLKGRPLRLRSVDKDNPGKCVVAIGSEAWFVGRSGVPTWPERAGGSQTKPNQACTPLDAN